MPGLPHFNYYLNNESHYAPIEHFVSGSNEDVFAMFYAPWCPHCKTAEPHFDNSLGKIAVDYDDYISGNYKKHKGKVALVKINGDKYPKLMQKIGVEGFPTFKYISGVTDKENLLGGSVKEYNDARNESAFTQFCDSTTGGDEHFTNYKSDSYETFDDYKLDYDHNKDNTLYN